MNFKIFFNFLFVILIFAFLIFNFSKLTAWAQQEVPDYQYQYEKYRGFEQGYLKVKESYVKYQTLTSQEEFISASQDFLFSRSIVIRTYLQVMKSVLRDAVDIDPTQKRELTLALDGEITWLQGNETQIKNMQNPTFNDLLEISLRVEKKANLYQKLAYQTLANIILGKMRALSSETVAINFLLEDKIKNSSSDKNTVTLEQWLQTVRDKTYQGQKNIEKAEEYLNLLARTGNGKEALDNYKKIQEELGKARVSFMDNLNYQKEIFSEVNQ